MRQYVWDLPTRITHWGLALAIPAAWITGDAAGEWLEWHERLAMLVMGLLIFRLCWGFIGSYYARFSQFFPTPSRLSSYFAGQWRQAGHSPLAALSVFALLGAMALQLLTGLFMEDETGFQGPWAWQLSGDMAEVVTELHEVFANAILVLVGLHLAAIAYYQLLKRRQLVSAMIHGYTDDAQALATKPVKASWIAWVLSVSVAALATWALFNPPAPPPPPPVETPDW